MARLRLALLALAVGSVIACELIDPLDDVSTGSGKKSGTSTSSSGSAGSTSSSSGSGDDDDVVVNTSSSGSSSSSSGRAPFCPGTKESEPNDTTPNPLIEGLLCGSLSSVSDVDLWQFENAGTTTRTIVVTVSADIDVSVSLTVTSPGGGLNQIKRTSGPAMTMTMAPGATLVVSIAPLEPFSGADDYTMTFSGG